MTRPSMHPNKQNFPADTATRTRARTRTHLRTHTLAHTHFFGFGAARAYIVGNRYLPAAAQTPTPSQTAFDPECYHLRPLQQFRLSLNPYHNDNDDEMLLIK